MKEYTELRYGVLLSTEAYRFACRLRNGDLSYAMKLFEHSDRVTFEDMCEVTASHVVLHRHNLKSMREQLFNLVEEDFLTYDKEADIYTATQKLKDYFHWDQQYRIAVNPVFSQSKWQEGDGLVSRYSLKDKNRQPSDEDARKVLVPGPDWERRAEELTQVFQSYVGHEFKLNDESYTLVGGDEFYVYAQTAYAWEDEDEGTSGSREVTVAIPWHDLLPLMFSA